MNTTQTAEALRQELQNLETSAADALAIWQDIEDKRLACAKRLAALEALVSNEVTTDADLVTTILMHSGRDALKFGAVCKLWLSCAQSVKARCAVLEHEVSKGRFKETDWGDDSDSESECDESELRCYAGGGGLASNAADLVFVDPNGHALILLTPGGEVARVLAEAHDDVPIAYPCHAAADPGYVYHAEAAGQMSFAPALVSKWDITTGELVCQSTTGDGEKDITGMRIVSNLVVVDDRLLVSIRHRSETVNSPAYDGVVLEYGTADLVLVGEFCRVSARRIAACDGKLFVLAEERAPFSTALNIVRVATYCVKSRELMSSFRTTQHAYMIAAQHDLLFIGTYRRPHERGTIQVLLHDGTPVQTITVPTTGGPNDLCIAHGKLYCSCQVEASEEELCVMMDDDGDPLPFTSLGGEEEMHGLSIFRITPFF